MLRPQLNRDPLAFTTIPEMTEIVPFQPSDYDDAMALWRQTEGLALRGADSREAVPGPASSLENRALCLAPSWEDTTAVAAIFTTSPLRRAIAAEGLVGPSRSTC